MVLEVSVEEGGFVVTAWDSEDGTELKISRVRWDGSALRRERSFKVLTCKK